MKDIKKNNVASGNDLFHTKYKIWLEKDGAVFGDGLFKLLINVESLGSISQAAKLMGMSYRAAWGKIRAAEKRSGMLLVNTRIGGEMGGWAKLTPEAADLLKRYCRFQQEVDKCIQNLYSEIFTGL